MMLPYLSVENEKNLDKAADAVEKGYQLSLGSSFLISLIVGGLI